MAGMSVVMGLSPDNLASENEWNQIVVPSSEWKTTSFASTSVTSQAFSGQESGPPILKESSDELGWTETNQKRFQELAIEEAVGNLGVEEAAELQQLTLLRRAFHNPRSGEEVLWEFEQRRRTSELLKTLRRYVEFYKGADPAWIATEKSSN